MPSMDLHQTLIKYNVRASKLAELSHASPALLSRVLRGDRQMTADLDARLKVGLRNLVRERIAESAASTSAILEDGITLRAADKPKVRGDIRRTVENLENLGIGVIVDEVARDD